MAILKKYTDREKVKQKRLGGKMETKFDVFKKTIKKLNGQDMILSGLYLTVFMAIGILFKKGVIAYPDGMLSLFFDGIGTSGYLYGVYLGTFLLLLAVNAWCVVRFVVTMKKIFQNERYYDENKFVESIGGVVAFSIGLIINLALFSFYTPIYATLIFGGLILWSMQK